MGNKLNRLVAGRQLRAVGPVALALMMALGPTITRAGDLSVEDLENSVARAVGMVTNVWAKDDAYREFHRRLSRQVKGVPPWEEFVVREQWMSVTTTHSVVHQGIFRVRAEPSMEVAYGDIVEVTPAPSGTKHYESLGRVVSVLCRFADQDYQQCKENNKRAWFGADGKEIAVPYGPW